MSTSQPQSYVKPFQQDIRLSPAEILRGVYYYLQYYKRPFQILSMTPKCGKQKGIHLWPFLTTENITNPHMRPTSQLMPESRDSFVYETAMLYATLSVAACETTEYDQRKYAYGRATPETMKLAVKPVHLYFFLIDMLAIIRLNLDIVGQFTVDVFLNIKKAFSEFALRSCDLIVAKTSSLLHFKEVSIIRGDNQMFIEMLEENVPTVRPKSLHLAPTKNNKIANPVLNLPSQEEIEEKGEWEEVSRKPGFPKSNFNSFPVIESLVDLSDAHLHRLIDTVYTEPGKDDTIKAFLGVFPGRKYEFDLKHWTFDPKLDVIGKSFDFWNNIRSSDLEKDFRDHFRAKEEYLAQLLAEERLVRCKTMVDATDRGVSSRLLFKTVVLPILTAPVTPKGKTPTPEREKLENSLLGGWLNWFLTPLGFSKILEEKPELATPLFKPKENRVIVPWV